MDTNFEEKYEDVLQNLELALLNTYRAKPEFVDSSALYVVETLIKIYTEEQRGREAKIPDFLHHEQEAFYRLQLMCEWRLGRKPLPDDMLKQVKNSHAKPEGIVKTSDEIIACLKRIKKSIEMWGKQSSSRRAYYNFVSKFAV